MAEADDQKPIQVGTSTRTIQARAVTFTCVHCGHETTIQQYPGYPPQYCSADCKRAVHRVRDRERKARQRAEARAAESRAVSDPRIMLNTDSSVVVRLVRSLRHDRVQEKRPHHTGRW